jgi:hypothetical protein
MTGRRIAASLPDFPARGISAERDKPLAHLNRKAYLEP